MSCVSELLEDAVINMFVSTVDQVTVCIAGGVACNLSSTLCGVVSSLSLLFWF